jgi:Protein of unknown function (DUF3800)
MLAQPFFDDRAAARDGNAGHGRAIAAAGAVRRIAHDHAVDEAMDVGGAGWIGARLLRRTGLKSSLPVSAVASFACAVAIPTTHAKPSRTIFFISWSFGNRETSRSRRIRLDWSWGPIRLPNPNPICIQRGCSLSAALVYELCRMALGDRDGMVAMLKAYMDESGVHNDSPVLTVAAYLARAPQWRDWTKKWNVAKRPIKVFHAADAANRRGEFDGWSEDQVAALVVKLLQILTDADFPGVVVGIHMAEFKKAIAPFPDLKKIFGTPYAACFHWVTQIILNIQAEYWNDDRIGFIHECNDYQYEALQAFNWIKTYGNPQGALIGLQFGDKTTHTPLQCADILAYEGNKRMRDSARPERRPWGALNSKGAILAAHYGRQNMGELIERLEKVRDGKINEIDLGTSWRKAAGPWAAKTSLQRGKPS